MADKTISALTGASTPLAGTEVLPIVQGGSTVKVSIANVTAGRAMSALSGSFGTGTPAYSIGGTQVGITNTSANAYLSIYGGAGTTNGGFIIGANNAENFANIIWVGTSNYLQIATTPVSSKIQFNVEGIVIGDINTNGFAPVAGKGIDFSANTGSAGMTSELLNWYEEGTFTPTFTGLTVGNGSVFGYYRRIGKQVFVTYGFITGSTSVVAALTGVSGFPFTTGTVGGSRFFPVTGVAFEGGVGWYGAASAIFSAATSGIGVFSPTNNTGFSATVPFTWGADDSVSLTATYFVD
jgi:hypothetical protein